MNSKISQIVIISFLLNSAHIVSDTIAPLKKHEEWWEIKCREKKHFDDFMLWQGTENAISRIFVRLHILNKGYKSILDIPCGMCVDYDALKRACPDLNYLGIDIANTFITKVSQQGITAKIGRIQEIPCTDSSYEVAYARYILEHLMSYKEAIEELVRVASKEVIIVFFSKPHDDVQDKITIVDVNGYPVYHNRYSKSKMETFITSLPKVKSFSWQEIKNKDESILHIMVGD